MGFSVLKLDDVSIERFNAQFVGDYEHGEQVEEERKKIEGYGELKGETSVVLNIDRKMLCDVT